MPVRSPLSLPDFAAYYQLRYQILRQPWGQSPGSERADDDDAPTTTHALFSTDDGRIVGVARLHSFAPHQSQVRYMAVDPAFQGLGIGRQLLQYLEEEARRQGHTECILHARQEAVPFYERLGYRIVAPSHQLFGTIQHFLMCKDL